MVSVEIVTTVDRFMELEEAWRTLWHETGARVFQSHAWLAAWARQMDRSYTLRIAVVWRSEARLVAVLPMAVRTFFGIRILEWAGQAVCDYCDGLGSLIDLQTAWKALRSAPGVDLLRLKNIRQDAETAVIFGSSGALTSDEAFLKVVSSWASGEAWFRTLNKKKRNNFSRGQRILEEKGAVSMVCYHSLPDEGLISRLLEFKKSWLKATKRQTSNLFDDQHPDRLLRLVQALAEVGRLRIFVIMCGNEIVSGSVNIADGRSLGAFFSAYNSKFDRVSPGIMLMTAYTRWAFDNGFTEVDYLQGDENYKFEFANAQTLVFSAVAAVNLRGRVAVLLHRKALEALRFFEKHEGVLRTGGAYLTKAGTARDSGHNTPMRPGGPLVVPEVVAAIGLRCGPEAELRDDSKMRHHIEA